MDLQHFRENWRQGRLVPKPLCGKSVGLAGPADFIQYFFHFIPFLFPPPGRLIPAMAHVSYGRRSKNHANQGMRKNGGLRGE